MDLPVLVLVMSDKCGACQNFKRTMLPELERELRGNTKFNLVVLNFPEFNIPVKSNFDYHPDLRTGFVQFFPTFLLFPGELWNDKTSKLKGVAKHDLNVNPNIDYSKKSILSWVDETVSQNPMFAGTKRRKVETVVPTYGTYTKFHSTKPSNTQL